MHGRKHAIHMFLLVFLAALSLLASCTSAAPGADDTQPPVDGDTDPDGDEDGDQETEDPVEPGYTACTRHADCEPDEICQPCARSSCPACDDCIDACEPHTCATETELTCGLERPDCVTPIPSVPLLVDGCWLCIDPQTCGEEFRHDARCDDGTPLTCDLSTPRCAPYEILAFRNYCQVCLDPRTCAKAKPPCESDLDCPAADYCDPCATPSCPDCDDCNPGCVSHGCETEAEPACAEERPDCGERGVAVVRDGCWVCLLPQTCVPVPTRPTHCDDGTEPTCEIEPPDCEASELLAHQDDCYICVNPTSCKPWGTPGCNSDADCPPQSWCDPCGTAACPLCPNCASACVPHGCETDTEATCNTVRPDCPVFQIAVIADGCWVCVHQDSCEVADRDTHCDDGSTPSCEMTPPPCSNYEILAYQNDCYRCVNPTTCVPWGEPGCGTDADCPPTDHCYMCGTSSCPACLDCLDACVPHGCQTEAEADCRMVRPDCGQNAVAVVRDGCWVCVDARSCAPTRNAYCDDGTEIVCAMIPPTCGENELLAHREGCYVCVNALTCRPWGESGCSTDADCRPTRYCNDCGTSSCPMCDDCVPACLLHGCTTQNMATCDMIRPDCEGHDAIAVIRNGCWECVDWQTCE